MKKVLLICWSMVIGFTLSAQDIASPVKSFADDPIHHPLFPLYVVTCLVFVTILLVLVVAVMMLKALNAMVQRAAEEKAAKLGVPYVAPQSEWSKLWQKANAMQPLEEEKGIELDHNYDGIRELDNHLPPWWKGLFYGSIVFAVVYIIIYHFSGSFPLSVQEYENEVAMANEQARILKASQPLTVIDENSLTYTPDAEIIGKGKALFMTNNCGSCHRNDGGGNAIGPNLTDEYWLHGGSIKNIFVTVKDGVIEKAMPAWGKVMSQQDVRNLAFFVMSLQNSNPKGAKAPQGQLYKPEQTNPSMDSTKVQTMLIKK